MNRKLVALSISLLLCFINMTQAQENISSLERHWEPNVEKVRIISYNVFNGFDFSKDKEREERFTNWIKDKKPEVLALQELYGFTQESLSLLAKKWGHMYAEILNEDGAPIGITSKKPIKLKNKIVENIGHGLLHVETYGFDFLVTHLNPFDTKKRLQEAQFIIDYIERNKIDNFLLIGDLNAHSPMDADYMEENATNLQRVYGGENSPNLMKGRFDYSTISRLLSYPMVDICREYVAPNKRFTYPTPILMSISKNKEVRLKLQERIDYIFIPVDMVSKVVDAFIFNDDDTQYLSDHYPIGVDLLL